MRAWTGDGQRGGPRCANMFIIMHTKCNFLNATNKPQQQQQQIKINKINNNNNNNNIVKSSVNQALVKTSYNNEKQKETKTKNLDISDGNEKEENK